MTSESSKHRVWFITGGSTGFGRELVEQALTRGDTVIATARKPETLATFKVEYNDRCLVLPLDVTSQSQVDAAVASSLDRFGRIDVLVNNAGYGMAGAVEETSAAEFMPMFDTNVFGLVRVTQAVLPHMRSQKSGHIVNLSSIGGLVGTAGFGFYNATKFAVEGLSEALADEVRPLGIAVTIVEPGPFRTEFLARKEGLAATKIADYDQTSGKMRAYFADQDGKQRGDPAAAAKAIIEAVEAPQPPLHLLLGAAALQRLRVKLDKLRQETDSWQTTTLGADFPEGE